MLREAYFPERRFTHKKQTLLQYIENQSIIQKTKNGCQSQALPQKDVALVLGLSHIYYRVLCNRVKSFALQVKGRILGGERLPLNRNASEMRERLDADFGGWYDLLSSYYAETIAHFTQAEKINALRYSYVTDSSDMLLHDVDCIFQYGGSRLYEHNFFVTLSFDTEII